MVCDATLAVIHMFGDSVVPVYTGIENAEEESGPGLKHEIIRVSKLGLPAVVRPNCC